MDKEILAVIGRLYLDVMALNNHIESQNQKIAELENKIVTLSATNKKN